MAERKELSAKNKVDIAFKDGTPTTYAFDNLAELTSFSMALERTKEVVIAVDGGASFHYGHLDDSISGPSKVTATWLFRDPKNVADTTWFELHLQLYNAALANGYAAAPSTNPLVHAVEPMMDMQITLYNLGGSGTNHVLTAACVVVTNPTAALAGSHRTVQIEYDIVETWARS